MSRPEFFFPDRPGINNGRVDTTVGENQYKAFDLYKEAIKDSKNFRTEAVRNVHSENEVSNVFFSDLNINTLQDAIRYAVFKKSCGKHIIDRQSDTELKLIMRGIYLDYGVYQPHNVLQQVKDLNGRVIDYASDRILQEIGMYMYYKRDITNMPTPMDRGMFSSSKGEKVNELKRI